MPFHVFLIQHPSGTVLFDLGAHPDMAHDPRARLGAAADDFDVRLNPEDDIIPQMAKVGVTPEDIDIVVLSHLHYDHCGGIEFFPRRTVPGPGDRTALRALAGRLPALRVREGRLRAPGPLARFAPEARRVRRRPARRVPDTGPHPGAPVAVRRSSTRTRSCSAPTPPYHRRTTWRTAPCRASSGAPTRWSRAGICSRSSPSATARGSSTRTTPTIAPRS